MGLSVVPYRVLHPIHHEAKSQASTMADDSDAVALLHLTVLSAQSIKPTIFLGKTKPSVVAFIDPRFSKSTKTLNTSTRNPIWNQTLSFPLSSQTIQNPNSGITIQVLFFSTKVVGFAFLPLSAVSSEAGIFAIQLQKHSGRPRGTITVSARIVWGFVTGVPVASDSPVVSGLALGARDTLVSGYVPVIPTAPPLAAARESNVKNFLIGLISGVVAAVIVGSSVV